MSCILFTKCSKSAGHNTDKFSEICTIDFEQGFDTERQMFISEIADSIEYIELKTPDDIVITRIWDIIQVDEYLIIKARVDVYLFHRNGQFIRQIGARGQGPGEYIVPCDMDFDKKNKEIIIADTRQFLFYDLKGNFLRSKKRDVNIPYIGVSDSILWIGTEISSADSKYKAVAISLQGYGDTLAHLLNPLCGITESGRRGAPGNPRTRFFYHEKDYLYFIGDMSNDTIWRLSGVSAEPYAFVDMGKYKLPVEFEPWYSSMEVYMQNKDKYWCVSSIVEDKHYFFLFSHKRNYTKDHKKGNPEFVKYIVSDKNTGKSFSVKDNNGIGFSDDFLGGPPVWPHFSSDDYFIDWIETHELLEMIEVGEYTPAPQLEELLSRIDNDSNDIVILIHRKK
ncbi:MAG: 6-bladed beta-propeller [Tannerella sp.]|jgi:hypothetical protein|nr:6-bladed beta-propeller [Tannerella sp.]